MAAHGIWKTSDLGPLLTPDPPVSRLVER